MQWIEFLIERGSFFYEEKLSTYEKEERTDINTIIPRDPDIYQGVMITF